MGIYEEYSQVQIRRRTTSSCVNRHGHLRRVPYFALFLGIVCMLSSGAPGDTLQLRNGTALQGGFVSFDGETIKFATNLGLQSIPRSQALVLTFAAPPTATASASPACLDSGGPNG